MTSKDSVNSFGARDTLKVGGDSYEIYRLDAVPGTEKLPYSLKVLAENLLRNEDGSNITKDHIEAIAQWDPKAEPSIEIQYTPARVVMQDFTGVPCIVDLATMREAVGDLGGDPEKVNPLAPADLVIDHSVIADLFGTADAFERNVEIEYERNGERYQFLRWGQGAFDDFKVVPPGTGIVHQVNIEYLASVVMTPRRGGLPRHLRRHRLAHHDGQRPRRAGLGCRRHRSRSRHARSAGVDADPPGRRLQADRRDQAGRHRDRCGAHRHPDAAQARRRRQVRRVLRRRCCRGAVGQPRHPGQHEPRIRFHRSDFPDRPGDHRLPEVHRPQAEEQLALVEAYAKEQGLWHDPKHEPAFSEYLELDLSEVVPSIAGPKRPQDRIVVVGSQVHLPQDDSRATSATTPTRKDYSKLDEDDSTRRSRPATLAKWPTVMPTTRRPVQSAAAHSKGRPTNPVTVKSDERGEFVLDHGAVVIAAITSCTNTSNPEVMLGAALLARNAVEKGLTSKPWVKTTMAPGSQVVNDYYEKSGLWPYLEKLGFYLVGYGCTTCIGNSGPLPEEISKAINDNDLAVTAVLSGNRNFEGRINPGREDELPGLAAAGDRIRACRDHGLRLREATRSAQTRTATTSSSRTSGRRRRTSPTPSPRRSTRRCSPRTTPTCSRVTSGGATCRRRAATPSSGLDDSTYVRKPPYFDGMPAEPEPVSDISGARVLALLGDSVTTDHISPASSIKPGTPAAQYLDEHGVDRKDYNSFGSRRGNHEVMIRGTFANIRLRNQLLDDVSGGYTRDFTQDGAPQAFIYDAAQNYAAQDIPLVVLGGKEYGSGSSRDWAAKGTSLLGVRAVIAESFERIHRSNLIGMGVIPLQFPEGKSAGDLGLDGTEVFDITGIEELNNGKTPKTVHVKAAKDGGKAVEFDAVVRIDTPGEADYYRNGGILQYVLRNMLRSS